MKLYSDTLTRSDLWSALPEGVDLEAVTIKTPRKRERGYVVRLSSDNGRRRRNSGTYGAEETRAATWDEHGEWMARLFEKDPDAIIGIYNGRDEFTYRTEGAYA